MKLELLVIAYHHGAVNAYPRFALTARHVSGVKLIRRVGLLCVLCLKAKLQKESFLLLIPSLSATAPSATAPPATVPPAIAPSCYSSPSPLSDPHSPKTKGSEEGVRRE